MSQPFDQNNNSEPPAKKLKIPENREVSEEGEEIENLLMRDGNGIAAEFDLEGTVKNATELLEILDENSFVMNQPFSDLTLEFYKMTHNTDIVMGPTPDQEKEVLECTENQEIPQEDDVSVLGEDNDSEDSEWIIKSDIITSEPTPAQEKMPECTENQDDDVYELTQDTDIISSEPTPAQDEMSTFAEDPKTPEELARGDVVGDSDDDLIIEYCKLTRNPDIVILEPTPDQEKEVSGNQEIPQEDDVSVLGEDNDSEDSEWIIKSDIIPSEPSPTQEKVPKCTKNQETSQRNLADLLRKEIDSEDSDDSLATIWNSCIDPNPEELVENFEEGPVIFSVSELKEMPKKGQMMRDLDISKVDTLSDTCSIKEIFNPRKSLIPLFIATSFEPDAVLVVDGNHRMAALSKRNLTDVEKSMKVACTIVIVPKSIFEVAWNYSKSLHYSDSTSSSDLDRINLPQSIIEFYIRSTPGDFLGQECAFTLKNQIHAYMNYFEQKFSETERKEMMNNAEIRNRERKHLLEWDVSSSVTRRNTQKDLFSIFCMPELTRNVIIDSLKSGFRVPTGSHFVKTLFSYSIKNDEAISRELRNERFNPKPRKAKELLRTLKRIVEDDGTLEGNATNGRFSEFGVKIDNIEEATSDGFVVFNNKIPNIDILNARNLNAFVVSPGGDNKAVQGVYQSGVFNDDTGKETAFEISGHLVRNDIDEATRKKVFTSIASAINGWCQLETIKKGCVCPIYHLEQSDAIITID